MRRVRSALLCGILGATLSCAQPPQAIIEAARTAVNAAAKNADIVTYAPESLRAAQDDLAAMDAEADRQARRFALSRDFKALETLAANASDAAQLAQSNALESKARVEQDAATLADQVGGAIHDFETRLWSARRLRGVQQSVIDGLSDLGNDSRASLDDARGDLASGSYASAKAKLSAILDRLDAAQQTIDEQTGIARAR